MKVKYEKELNKVCLHIDLPQAYEEDYQIHMLKENDIPCLLDITGCGIDGRSRYSYTVTGMISMKTMFEESPIKRDDMILFVNNLMEAVKSLRRYMLNPDGLLLYPEFMFYSADTWHFCYLPARKRPLCEAFHVITEYFVKKLDYEETEGILLAYELHKASLQENYDLEKIMDGYREHEEKRRASMETEMKAKTTYIPDEPLFTVDEEEYVQTPDVETIREMGGHLSPWKKAADKVKKGRWGKWKDLILETDGHQEEEPL